MSYEALCSTHAVRVERANRSHGTHGGVTQSPTLVPGLDAVDCTIQPLRWQEQRRIMAQRQVYVTHRLYAADDLGLARDDRLVVLDPDSGQPTARVFLVQGRFDQAGRGRVFSIDVREQTP